MPKSDLYSNSLPLLLVAALLSGGLWRGDAQTNATKPGESGGGSDNPAATASAGSWVSDTRPVLESLAAAVGFDEPAGEISHPVKDFVLAKDADTRSVQMLDAMNALRGHLNDTLSKTIDEYVHDGRPDICTQTDSLLDGAATRLGTLLLIDDDKDKTRVTAANALLDEYRDWRMLRNLAWHVRNSRTSPKARPRYEVRFMIATVPDYVDSNSGWIADQVLTAIQSGMTRNEYVFDRVKLIDWSRSPTGSQVALPASRLHEQEPGAMIFRQVEPKDAVGKQDGLLRLQVVLLVLETPTAGVHRLALSNSLRFLRAWDACSGTPGSPLRVLGPSFSGSIVSLASEIGRPEVKRWFPARLVISGSASADANVQRMRTFGNGAIYRATVQPTSSLINRMAAFLKSMNPDWKDGCHVALLIESNTAYGGGTTREPEDPQEKRGSTTQTRCGASARTTETRSKNEPEKRNVRDLPDASVFYFPLHVAQLRNDAPASLQPGTSLLPTAIVPLNMRETAPPTDLVPALRPQLTSPVVEATIDSIFDTIRHEKLNAVGIIATDDRDVLFLAREVKRASPDVQLFLLGTHALYLHPDYVPYLRGALVASSYSLSLGNQPEVGDPDRSLREPFQSLNAEGVFHATRALLSELSDPVASAPWTEKSVPYCDADHPPPACVTVAPVSINVIGEDGYWMLPAAPPPASAAQQSRESKQAVADRSTSGIPDTIAAPLPIPPPPPPNHYPLPPLPGRMLIATILIVGAIASHLLVLVLIRREQRRNSPSLAFFGLPLVRILAPPDTVKAAAQGHRVALTMCFVLLALVAAWLAAVTLPFSSVGHRPGLVPGASILIAASIVVAVIRLYQPAQPETDDFEPNAENAPERGLLGPLGICKVTTLLLLGGMLATIGLFIGTTTQLLIDGADTANKSLVLSRIVGAGILSPMALTLGLMTAVYAAVVTGVRRLSLVGLGYVQLSRRSRAFALLTGEKTAPADAPHLARLLDMPAQNLPNIYPLAVVLVLGVACLGMFQVSTIEGRMFSWFVRAASLTALGLGLMLLAQGLATWNTARAHLKRLARSRLEPHFTKAAPYVPWEISLAPPRLTELVPMAHMADDLMREFRSISLPDPYVRDSRESRRTLGDISPFRIEAESRLGLRDGDMAGADALFAPPSHTSRLESEMDTRQQAALIQSESWFHVWRLSDALVGLMERTYWRRSTPAAVTTPAAVGAGVALARRASEEFQLAWPGRLDTRVWDTYGLAADPNPSNSAGRDGWFGTLRAACGAADGIRRARHRCQDHHLPRRGNGVPDLSDWLASALLVQRARLDADDRLACHRRSSSVGHLDPRGHGTRPCAQSAARYDAWTS